MNYELKADKEEVVDFITDLAEKYGWKVNIAPASRQRIVYLTFDTCSRVVCWNSGRSVCNYTEIDINFAVDLIKSPVQVMFNGITISYKDEYITFNGCKLSKENAGVLRSFLYTYLTYNADEAMLELNDNR